MSRKTYCCHFTKATNFHQTNLLNTELFAPTLCQIIIKETVHRTNKICCPNRSYILIEGSLHVAAILSVKCASDYVILSKNVITMPTVYLRILRHKECKSLFHDHIGGGSSRGRTERKVLNACDLSMNLEYLYQCIYRSHCRRQGEDWARSSSEVLGNCSSDSKMVLLAFLLTHTTRL